MDAGTVIVLLFVGVVAYAVWHGIQVRRERARRLKALEISHVDAMSGPEFEYYVSQILESQGYHVQLVGHSGDLGVDLMARRNGSLVAIQCKRQSKNVSRRAVSDVVAGKIHRKAGQAMCITNSWFTAGARTLAKSTGCELIDRRILAEWIAEFQGEVSTPRRIR